MASIRRPHNAQESFSQSFILKNSASLFPSLLFETLPVSQSVVRLEFSLQKKCALFTTVQILGQTLAVEKTSSTVKTAAIADYLDDETVSLDDRGAPWQDIAEAAGVELPKTQHLKPPGLRTLTSQSIQRACRDDEDIINAVCEEEKELKKEQAKQRYEHAIEQLTLRPRSYNWKDVAFCDEFHLGIGPQVTKYVKRRRGKESREKLCNVHFKKITSKDTKAKAREEEHLPLLNVFIVIRHNYKRIIPYEVPSNSFGKMTTKVYTQEILLLIKDDLLSRELTLWQDKDSTHDSNGTKAWFQKNHVSYITSPGNSPDLSIFESYAHPLKKHFHTKRSRTKKEALARFSQVFEEEFDQGVNSEYV